MKILKIKIQVEDKVEAYKIVSELGFEHDIVNADFDGHKEKFDKENTPNHFMRDNSKNKKKFRDIKKERKLNK